MSADFDIAVVGGGPVAASMALGLSGHGLKVVQIGKLVHSSVSLPQAFDSRVYALTPRSVSWLQKTSLWQGLTLERISPIRQMVVSDPKGAPLRFHSEDQLACIVEHAALVHASAIALKFSNVSLRDDEAVSVIANEQNSQITTKAGDVVSAKLVIAADGANSLVRASAGIEVSKELYPHTALVANLWIPDQRLEAETAFQWFGKDDIVALLPMPSTQDGGRMFNLVWSCPKALAESVMSQLVAEVHTDSKALTSALAQSLARIDPVVARLVGQSQVHGKVQALPLLIQKAASLVAERVCLIGDAAHVIHPLAGQGMNLGFGDAQALFETLTQRERLRDLADPMLFRRYARKRSLTIALMQQTTNGLSGLFAETKNPVQHALARVMHWGWQRLDTLEPIKRQFIAQASR